MSNLAEQLMESASAVAALGCEPADFAALDDASVVAGMSLVRDHQRALQVYEIRLAAEISRRSSHEFGNSGLARRNGSATPAILIQTITGSSNDEATTLARLGQMVNESAPDPNFPIDWATDAPTSAGDASIEPGTGSTSTDRAGSDDRAQRYPVAPPLATAALSGEVSIAAADAIRKGLGRPDDAITAEQLHEAESKLLKDAGKVSPEALLKLARAARNELDLEAIERGAKQRSELRYVRRWQRDGMSGGSWRLPDEDGGAEIHIALGLLIASRTGGPRFPQTDADGNEVKKTAAEIATEDPRTLEQVLADGFTQIFHLGLTADHSVVPGAGRAAVRVIVEESVLREQRGSAILEETRTPITFAKLGEYICGSGLVGVLFAENAKPLDVGRTQRLHTKRQRVALAVRDGGCRYPGCDKPVSWTEGHHALQWARDHGGTDVDHGISLCVYHHKHIHETGAEVINGDSIGKPGTFWLQPGRSVDPTRTLIEMPSKNPIIAAMNAAAAR